MTDKKIILKELAKRQKRIEQRALEPRFIIEDYCFDRQIAFINDESKFKTAVCSRRSGKTVACASDLVNTCLKFERINCAYITLSRRSAKNIIWRDLMFIIKKYKIPVKIDHTELSITFLDTDSVISVTGATDDSNMEVLRGRKFKKVYIDECQSFRPYIESLISDVIIPALYDLDGALCLIGTPGPIPVGYFYDMSQNQDWSHHHWTIFDNPFIKKQSGKDPSAIIKIANKARGIDETHPTHIRENLGKWVHDSNALVFAFNGERNFYAEAPKGELQYIFGIDIGWSDADAVAVIGYNYEEKVAYIIEEHVQRKQTISDLVAVIRELQTKYNPIKMVMDAGALGKKIQEEILQRYQLFIEAAEKHRKLEFIELMNDDLRTGKIKTFKGSKFAEDCLLVQWDRSNSHKPRVSDAYHTDIGDAVLYAWRECKHYLSSPAVPLPLPGTDAYMQQYWEQEAEKMAAKKDKSNADDILGSQDDMDSLIEGIGDLYED